MAEIDYCVYAERLEYLKKYPSVFIEEVTGVKLNKWQKIMVNNINKIQFSPRISMKKWNNYINLLLTYSRMKDDDCVIIATPKKWDKLSKEQFAEYIENYWK